MRLLRWIAILTVLLFSTSAFATFPGQNGKIVFNYQNDQIATMNADGSGLTILHPEGYVPRWSPDGSRIVYLNGFFAGGGLWIMKADGSNKTQLIAGCCYMEPTFSPDGLEIYYGRNQNLYKVSADGTGGEPFVLPLYSLVAPTLTADCYASPAGDQRGWANLYPASLEISPDGTKVAFDFWCSGGTNAYLNGMGGYWNIYVVNIDGSDLTQITYKNQINHYSLGDNALTDNGCIEPKWSPDGTKLLFQCFELYTGDRYSLSDEIIGQFSIEQANADGTHLPDLFHL